MAHCGDSTMSGVSLGGRTVSNGSLPNAVLQTQNSFHIRKPSRVSLSSSREKERFLPCICRHLGRRKVGMLILIVFAVLIFLSGFIAVTKEEGESENGSSDIARHLMLNTFMAKKENIVTVCDENKIQPQTRHHSLALGVTITGTASFSEHRCTHFAFPPPPPGVRRRIGPRPCPVCYLPVEQAIARMPSSPSVSPVLQHLTYFREENPRRTEPHGGSEFGGFPTLKQRNDSFNVSEAMTLHCGFVKGCTPGQRTGFDIDEVDLRELQQFHDVIVASAIFGNYDMIQHPENVSAIAKERIPFYMFIDEETEKYMKNSSGLDSSKRIGLWRIIVVRNIPYADPRRNGKVPKLLLHRLFPNVRYSIWIDGKLRLVKDPYQILERFLWRENATFAISRHYRRFDVFEEAEANKAAGKYDNGSINYQVDFYKAEGLTPYSEAKLPITSDVPEGCVLIKEHIPITNLFTCLWYNEVDRFTSRDQLSFSTVRDKISANTNWGINMFLDCERRNFVIQEYHRDVIKQLDVIKRSDIIALIKRRPPPVPVREISTGKSSAKKSPSKHGKARKSSSRRHRKVVVGSRDTN